MEVRFANTKKKKTKAHMRTQCHNSAALHPVAAVSAAVSPCERLSGPPALATSSSSRCHLSLADPCSVETSQKQSNAHEILPHQANSISAI